MENCSIFKIVGVTFKNSDGTDRQKNIKDTLNERKNYLSNEDLFNSYSNKDIEEMNLNVSEFEDVPFQWKYEEGLYNSEKTIKIFISDTNANFIQIGNIAKEDISNFIDIINNYEIIYNKCYMYITGGKIKYYDDETEKVKTDILTYGALIKLFYK